MTLVIAKKLGDSALLISDTWLTQAFGARSDIHQSALKVARIRENLWLAYAGNTAYASEALLAIHSEMSTVEIRDIALRIHNSSHSETVSMPK